MRRFVTANQQEWAFWTDGKRLVFRPLGAARYAQEYLFSRAKLVVIMSATILDFNVFRNTLGIDENDCLCLQFRPNFWLGIGLSASGHSGR
jgi:Rad3-related DNA helicase